MYYPANPTISYTYFAYHLAEKFYLCKNFKNMKAILFISLLLTITLTAKSDNLQRRMRLDMLEATAHDSRASLDDRRAAYNSLTALTEWPASKRFYIELANLEEQNGDLTRAISVYDSLESHLWPDDLPTRLSLYHRKAALLYLQNKIGEAMNLSLKVIATPKPDSLRPKSIDSYRLLSDLFVRGGRTDMASEFLERADAELTLYSAVGFPPEKVRSIRSGILASQSSIAATDGDYVSAYRLLRQAETAESDSFKRIEYMAGLGALFQLKGENDEAERLYRATLAKGQSTANEIMALCNWIDIKLENGDITAASELLEEYGPRFHYGGAGLLARALDYRRYLIARRLGDTDKAISILDRAYNIMDSTAQALTAEYAISVIANFDTEQRNNELTAQAEKGRQRDLWLITVCITVIIMLCALIIMWRNLRQRRRKENILEQQLKSASKEKAHAVKSAEDSLEQRNRELTSMSLHMKKINEALNTIDRISRDENCNDTPSIREIRKTLRSLKMEENVWEMFRLYFGEVNRDFFNKLTVMYPNLTKTEVRLCAYMSLGMTSKEIAGMTSRSVRTVDTLRYNIRRKMKIEGSTEAWLRHIAATSLETLRQKHTFSEKQ